MTSRILPNISVHQVFHLASEVTREHASWFFIWLSLHQTYDTMIPRGTESRLLEMKSIPFEWKIVLVPCNGYNKLPETGRIITEIDCPTILEISSLESRCQQAWLPWRETLIHNPLPVSDGCSILSVPWFIDTLFPPVYIITWPLILSVSPLLSVIMDINGYRPTQIVQDHLISRTLI